MRRQKKRRRATGVPRKLLDLGYPEDLPPLPDSPQRLIDPGLPGDWGLAAEYARTEGLQLLLKTQAQGIWGCGAARDAKTGGPSVVFLTESKQARGLPKIVSRGSRTLPVTTLQLSRRFRLTQGPPLVRNNQAAGLTGSSVSDNATFNEGGTLAGTFPSLSGGGQRGLTNCHVAVGFNFQEFLQQLPTSIGWLFRSPAGRSIVTPDVTQVGQPVFELFKCDTPFPTLTFLPLPLPALSFLYTDVAAGPVRPRAIPNPFPLPPPPPPPPPPPRRTTIFGARLRPGIIAVPGTAVYKIGQATGVTWGTTLIAGLVAVLPAPIPGVPALVIFNINLYALPMMAGDSGSDTITEGDQRSTGLAGLALGTSLTGVNPITVATALPVVNLFANVRM